MDIYFEKLGFIISNLPAIIGFIMFAYLYYKHYKNNLTLKLSREAIWLFALFSIFLLIIQVVLQYTIISSNSFLELFIPPAQDISWFLHVMWSVYISPFIFAVLAGGLIYFFAASANKLFKKELFVENDKYLLFLAALVVQWPNFVVYLVLLILLTILQSFILSLKHSFNARLIITQMLIIAVFITVFFGNMMVRHFELYYLGI